MDGVLNILNLLSDRREMLKVFFFVCLISGAVIMGIGSLVFMIPHFSGEPNPGVSLQNQTSDNICRGISLRDMDMGLGRLSLSNPPLAPHNNLR